MLGVGVLACMWTQGVRADGCTQSSDCPKGYTCHEYQSGACAAAKPCAQGEKCPAPPPCEVVTQHECAPGSCNSNADCADFMVCYESSISVCSGGAAATDLVAPCPPNQTCPAPKPMPMPMPQCTETKQKQCTPRYELPCQADADCGAGFSCEANQECTCSGSAGRASSEPAPAPAADAGTASSGSGMASDAFAPALDAGVAKLPAPDATAPVCECHASEVKSCRVKEVKCQADSDCPSNFACITFASGGGSTSCAVPKGADGGACTPTEIKTIEEKRCEPKYSGGSAALASKDGSTQAPTVGGTDTAAGPVPSADPRHTSDAGAESAEENEPLHDEAACCVRTPGAHDHVAAGYAFGFALLALSLRRRKQR